MGEIEPSFDDLLNLSFDDNISALATAAHELKSPLSLIRQLSLVLNDGDITDCEKEKIVEQIKLTSERALRLTSDLTKSIRLDDALFKLEPINPKQLCKDVVYELQPLYRAHDRKLKLASKKHSALLIANRDLLKRIVVNFSDNALYYAKDSSEVEIKISSHSAGKVIRLGVRDYGPALPIDTIRKLQNKLLNSPMPVYARPQSSGLGLFIASKFADMMNGKIGMIRHRDGVTFYVDLQASRQLNLL